ncbi:MAG: efflux RND transporter periplasmic adaptor subunit [Deltaproteobacteria bacterium]|nr:MAG: efflux RND transporter periplasmic adaptor subunit [Deltaproteobacteria bacterium]
MRRRLTQVKEVEASSVANLNGAIDFDEQRTARLNAAVPGRVVELLVQAGDHVDADQPVVALESPEVRTAEAEYVHAEADLVVARKSAERAERLHGARAIAEKDYLQAQQDAHKAVADFERARAQLDRLHLTPGERTSRYLVRAPFAGTVVARKASVGMSAGPDSPEPLVVISDLSQVRVVLRVPERQLPLIRPHQAVAVRVEAYPEEFPGEVTVVGDVIDDATRTVPVLCAVPNRERLLKPAMFARVTLKASPGLRILAIPASALLSDGQRFRVIVRRADGGLEPREVEAGAEIDGRAEVLSGLAAGEDVVSEGALFAAQALAS